MDKELKAMGSILKTLSEFDGETRTRIWGWIDLKLNELPSSAVAPSPLAQGDVQAAVQ